MRQSNRDADPSTQEATTVAEGTSRWDRLFAPVDIASVVFFRIAFAGIMLWHVLIFFRKDWIRMFFIDPAFHPSFYGFGWVKPWPGELMYVHFAVLGVAAAMMLVGLWYRVAAVVVWLAFTQMSLCDRTLFQNHYYLMSLVSFLLIFIPAHRAFSVDALIRPGLRRDDVPTWTVWMLRFLVAIPYFYGGLAKLNPDWLQGWPLRIWLAERTDFPVIGQYFTEEWCVYLFTYAGLIFDLAVVPLLLWRPTRLPAFLAAVIFHVTNSQLFEIDVFPWMMIGATLIFFPPGWPRTVLRKLHGNPGEYTAPPSNVPRVSGARRTLTVALLGLFVAVQVLVPLRHYLYPGPVWWTNEGYSFGWLMKSRNQVVALRYYVTDRRTGQSGIVDLGHYLSMTQIPRLGGDVDMVLEFAHFLQEDLKREGHDEVEIRALVLASLNGRAPQLMIDPSVDLTQQERTIWHNPLILPLTEPLRETPWNLPLTQWEQHPDVKTRVD